MKTHSCDSTEPIHNGKPIVNDTYFPSNTWGGNGSMCSCDQYMAAEGYVTVQNIGISYDMTDSVWVGLGGAASQYNALAQAGISQQTVSYVNTFNAFYESVACPGWNNAEYDLFRVDTGDQMYFYVNDAGHDHLYDYTKGTYDTVDDGCASHESAEWIVERNCDCPLAHYNPYTWSGTRFEDFNTNWGRLTFFGLWQWQLKDIFGNMMETSTYPQHDTNGDGGDNFTMTWHYGS